MQNFINNASNIHVIKGAISIKSNNLALGHILSSTNLMMNNPVNAIKNHFKKPRDRIIIPSDHINQYMAASCLLHSLDGWGYLSHAVESLLKGDNGIAIHLAYYAELRSSMSFLSSEGIGIFDRKHICINSSGNILKDPGERYWNYKNRRFQFRPLGTHAMVWEAIDKWVLSPNKPENNDILKIFSVSGKRFDEWVNAFPYANNIACKRIIKEWIGEWNFDVNYFKDDRKKRNEVSYRPKRLNNLLPRYSVNETISKLSTYWDILEPSQTNRFQKLDMYLLRMLLSKMYDTLSRQIKSSHPFDDVIKDTLNNLGLTHSKSLIDFLNEKVIIHKIFDDAKNYSLDPNSNTLNPLSVIARAILNLRISTGNVALIYNKAGILKQELNFLWESYGVENGFWSNGGAPNDFTELWDDIKDHIEDVTDWADSKKPVLSLFQIYEELDIPKSFNYFKQFNRACLWGMSI